MESAGVADSKARLSEYLARVKSGEEVLVTDQGRAIARLVPVGVEAVGDDEAETARLAAMEREGLVRLGSGRLPERFFEKERPEDLEGIPGRGRVGGASLELTYEDLKLLEAGAGDHRGDLVWSLPTRI